MGALLIYVHLFSVATAAIDYSSSAGPGGFYLCLEYKFLFDITHVFKNEDLIYIFIAYSIFSLYCLSYLDVLLWNAIIYIGTLHKFAEMQYIELFDNLFL